MAKGNQSFGLCVELPQQPFSDASSDDNEPVAPERTQSPAPTMRTRLILGIGGFRKRSRPAALQLGRRFHVDRFPVKTPTPCEGRDTPGADPGRLPPHIAG